MNTLRGTFTSVVHSLEHESKERKDAQALGLLTFCRNFKFVGTLLLLCDVLPPLARLSTSFQRKNMPFNDIKTLLDGCKASLQRLLLENGKHLCCFPDILVSGEWQDLGIRPPSDQALEQFKCTIKFH